MLLHHRLVITPARKFLMLSHTNPKRQRGTHPGGPSLTLRVGMTFFVAGVIASCAASSKTWPTLLDKEAINAACREENYSWKNRPLNPERASRGQVR